MKKHPFILGIFLLFSFTLSTNAQRKNSKNSDPVVEKIASLKKYEGFFDFYWDEKQGKIWLALNKDFLNKEFLYVNSLAAGLGSNDIGLDRGQLGDRRIVKFVKSGPKLLLTQPNYTYRANSTNPYEVKAVEEAFAQSVAWGFTVEVENADIILADLTPLLLQDAHGIAGRISRAKQGEYTVDQSRSMVYLPNTKNFPNNSEWESVLTLTGRNPGNFVNQVTPTPTIISLRLHHSFIQLPDDNYTPRVFHSASGYFGMGYFDYAVPINESIAKRLITRHRLVKKNPSAEISEAVEPIIYYLDRGAPEPVRSALLEGASWWNQAFNAIGYKDAFQVKLMPEGADPLDVRYNVIQWVHRSTRGWSYGSSVTDPRTGEIIKGHVTLGSLRVRQDFLIAQGLLGNPSATDDDPRIEMALARLRQLSAHEVGHTLGLAHNFAASSKDRASVMDYPYPYIEMKSDGTVDLSNAYDDKIGSWDKLSIAYGYQHYQSSQAEKSGLQSIINQAIEENHPYISDRDARPIGGAHPDAHLWDNGKNASDELTRLLTIRQNAIQKIDASYIDENEPLAQLEELLVPIYLMHRFQIEATSKLIGGLRYAYKMASAEDPTTTIVSAEEQRKAMDVLLQCIQIENLEIPEKILAIIPPKPLGYTRSRESFDSKTGLTFDLFSAAESLTNKTLNSLLHPQRAARLIEYHSRFSEQPGLTELLDKIVDQTLGKSLEPGPLNPGIEKALQQQVNMLVINKIISLALDPLSNYLTRSICHKKLIEIHESVSRRYSQKGDYGQYLYLAKLIEKYLKEDIALEVPKPARIPDGSPIGNNSDNFHQEISCDF